MQAWFDQMVFGNPLLDYVLALGSILVAFVVYFLVLKLAESRWLKRATESQQALYASILKLSKTPLKLVLATGVVFVTTQIFDFSQEARAFLESLLLGLVAVSVGYVLMKLIDVLFAYLQAKSAETETRLDDQLYPILGKAAKAFVVLVTALLIVQNWGYDISALLAGLGIGGLAVALAAQDTVSNLFGAFTIFVDRPFHIGDAVNLEGYSGTIENIGLRSTRLRTFEGTCVTLPNSMMTKAKIENLSNRTARRNLFTIGLTYDTPQDKLEQAIAILKEVLERHPGTQQSRVYFGSYGESALNIEVQLWSKHFGDFDAYVQSLEELNLQIKQRFEAAGIEMAYPTQTLFVHTMDSVKR